ncbi:MAG TPA: hypothetical protein ENG70_05890, partial [Candidatus Cloacimonetes bacterium]|nr:hypothetical protein [Candidatus Cloacimonadota bacterium]HEX38362.1 hypothetical protein [Candidatus Cloacimonadota bacterium]
MSKIQSLSPKNLEEYSTFFTDNKEKKFVIFAGGTDLMIDRFSIEGSIIIDISYLEECRGIKADEKHITIGAATTLNEILSSQEVQTKIPILIDAIKTMASIQVRNRATIGGNIGNASPAGDTITPLVVLETKIEIFSPESNEVRTIPIKTLFSGPSATTLEKGEIIIKIIIPLRKDKDIFCYFRKIGQRNAMTITKASLSAIAKYLDSKIEWIKLAPGSVSPVVKRMSKTEEFLKGKELTPAVINKAKEIIANEISPITDIRSTKAFRVLITK